MARSMRNHANRRSAPNVEQSLDFLVELVVREEDAFVEPGLALDTLDLGHVDRRNECWSGTSAIVSSTFRTGLAASRHAAPPTPDAEAYAVTSVETVTTGGCAIHPG